MAVPVPAPIVPYVPNVQSGDTQTTIEEIESWPNAYLIEEKSNSKAGNFASVPRPLSKADVENSPEADFQEFVLVKKQKKKRKEIKGYQETDRIDAPNEPLILDFKVQF